MSFYVPSTCMQNANALKFYRESRLHDRDFTLGQVKGNGMYLERVLPEFKDDKEVVLTAISQDGLAAEYASSRLRGDPNFMLQAFSRDIRSLKYATHELRNNAEFMERAFDVSSMAFTLVGAQLKRNRQIMIDAMDSCARKDLLKHVSEKLQAEYEFVSLCVSVNGLALEHAVEKLRDDADIVLAAVKQHGLALKFASSRLKHNRDVVLAAVSENPMALDYVHPDLRSDRAVVLCASRSGSPSAGSRPATAPELGFDSYQRQFRTPGARKSLMSTVLSKNPFARALTMGVSTGIVRKNYEAEVRKSASGQGGSIMLLDTKEDEAIQKQSKCYHSFALAVCVDDDGYFNHAENTLVPYVERRTSSKERKEPKHLAGLTPAAKAFVKAQAPLYLGDLRRTSHGKTAAASKKRKNQLVKTDPRCSYSCPSLSVGVETATPVADWQSAFVRPKTR